jgi:hypothetical protein
LIDYNNIPERVWKKLAQRGVVKFTLNGKNYKVIWRDGSSKPTQEDLPMLEEEISIEEL